MITALMRSTVHRRGFGKEGWTGSVEASRALVSAARASRAGGAPRPTHATSSARSGYHSYYSFNSSIIAIIAIMRAVNPRRPPRAALGAPTRGGAAECRAHTPNPFPPWILDPHYIGEGAFLRGFRVKPPFRPPPSASLPASPRALAPQRGAARRRWSLLALGCKVPSACAHDSTDGV